MKEYCEHKDMRISKIHTVKYKDKKGKFIGFGFAEQIETCCPLCGFKENYTVGKKERISSKKWQNLI